MFSKRGCSISMGVVLVALSIPSIVFAEQASPPFPLGAVHNNFFGFGLGVNLSNYSNMSGSNLTGATGSAEFATNVFADFNLGDIWYLETGLKFSSYGASVTQGNTSISFTGNYLEIPLLLKPTFDAGGWHPYFLAGPLVGFKVGESLSASQNGALISLPTSYLNTVNFAVDFGAGVEVPFGGDLRGYLQFDYALGLMNTLNSTGQSTFGISSSDTRGANITAGVAYPF